MPFGKLRVGLVSLGVASVLSVTNVALAAEDKTSSEQDVALEQALNNFKNSAQTLVGELSNSGRASLDEARKSAQEILKQTESSLGASWDETSQQVASSTAKTLNYLAQTTNELAKALKDKLPSEQKAILNLDSSLQQMRAFTANFNQEVYADSGEILSRSSGDIALQRPHNFIMNTLEPDKIVLYTKDEAIYYYDAAVEQVSIYSLDMLRHNPFLLLIERNTDVWSDFTVSQDGQRFTLVPKSSQDIRSLTLSFAPYTLKNQQGQTCKVLESITIRMSDGNTNFYHFSSQSADVVAQRFDVVLPADVEYNDERK